MIIYTVFRLIGTAREEVPPTPLPGTGRFFKIMLYSLPMPALIIRTGFFLNVQTFPGICQVVQDQANSGGVKHIPFKFRKPGIGDVANRLQVTINDTKRVANQLHCRNM
ncbi:MAG TPA: hypothetical protein DER60_00805 [Syntrophomonas sp.]|jgi:hypothetical protein|nr:hypothetical protein [Syntrophomonas sp.]